MKTVSIGYHREDGDFAVLATLNNNDDFMSDEEFKEVVDSLAAKLRAVTRLYITVLERQDAPDYVEVEQV
jgi:hypothetical protein